MLGASSDRLGTPTSVEFELDASPAKNTRSHRHTVISPPPVLASPTKKHRVKADDTDLSCILLTTVFYQLKRTSSKWAIQSDGEDEADISVPPDSMDGYLNTPRISKPELQAAGGVLQYWENARATRPQLAQMALDFLSAPASSVDAERAFSGGRLQVNHLQHRVNSQTFKAQVAVGSWYNTPLMNDLSAVTSIMHLKMIKGKGKALGKGKSNEIVID